MTHDDLASASSPAEPAAAPSGGASGGTAPLAASRTTTMTVTETQQSQPEVLRLTLRGRNNVQWDEAVVDNEGMGRKSSKRCCIFHKRRAFGESSTDSSEEEDKDGNGNRKIARPKKKEVPDFQRFHA
uniref:Type 1 phosphatases regulator n=1 Tax=Amphora coffeiformis TaxID=265554 RepID=A0A7S3P7B7_9STRA|mmetsp:Transcript_9261/g.17716  ORF Transcript_9261/g.17716 Transcript_9261/m.17716 type:complete len:128 (+) Transcript_9261:89-472(+)|eukprot:scaffold801_cov170-Amphora_coffeaeformis.AAC.7